MNTPLNQPTDLRVNPTTSEFVSFLAGANKIAQDNFVEQRPSSNARGMGVQVFVGPFSGPRYIRVLRGDTQDGLLTGGGYSSHCFIDRTTGDVLKSASYSAPAKGARGNIFDAANGLARMGPYGPAYNDPRAAI